jgi:hypothetical protein
MADVQSGQNARDIQMEEIARQLPDDHQILDAAYLALTQLHDACMRDDTAMRALSINRFEACIWKLNGNTFFGCGADEHAAASVIENYCRAESGTIPLWGQRGEFVIKSRCGTRACVKTEAGCMMNFLSVSFNALDLGAPFISETGYKSHIFQLSDADHSQTVESYALKVFEELLNASKTPIYVSAHYRDRLAANVLPEWLKELHPSPDRTPQTLPEGFVRVTATLPASKAFMARKWSAAAHDRIAHILQENRTGNSGGESTMTLRGGTQGDEKRKEYKSTLNRLTKYREFYIGARCEVVSVHHPVFAKTIGTIVKIVTIYDSGNVEAHEDKPVSYRLNRRGVRVVEFDPTCVRSFYSIDQLKLLDECKTGDT